MPLKWEFMKLDAAFRASTTCLFVRVRQQRLGKFFLQHQQGGHLNSQHQPAKAEPFNA